MRGIVNLPSQTSGSVKALRRRRCGALRFRLEDGMLGERANKGGSGAATAAEERCARFGEFLCRSSKFRGRGFVVGGAIDHFWQACVGLNPDGKRGGGRDAF